jgi:hypothetical protein
MHVLKAGALYFSFVFGVGFVLGTFRTLYLVPRIGTRTAELLEAPIMLVVTILAAKWTVVRLAVPSSSSTRLAMGGIALCLMHQRAADEKPTSSSSGGCRRHDRVRVSDMARSTDSNVADSTSSWLGASGPLSNSKFILMLVKYCPRLSWRFRAILRRSSSCERINLVNRKIKINNL